MERTGYEKPIIHYENKVIFLFTGYDNNQESNTWIWYSDSYSNGLIMNKFQPMTLQYDEIDSNYDGIVDAIELIAHVPIGNKEVFMNIFR